MKPMYNPGVVNSPRTQLAANISATQVVIMLNDISVLPDAPNLCMIGDGEDTETILYTVKSGQVLSGVTRAFQGSAKAWPSGTSAARYFAEYDYRALVENVEELDTKANALVNNLGQITITPTAWQAVGGEYVYTFNKSGISATAIPMVTFLRGSGDKIGKDALPVIKAANAIEIHVDEAPTENVTAQFYTIGG